jgi:methionyl-tRNA formyltransferase
MGYKRIVLIGFGKIAEECFRHILLNYSGNCSIDLIIYENHQFSRLPQIAAKNKIVPLVSNDKRVITEFLLSISEKTLIVSANNNYIFSKRVVEKTNLTIVNFHNSLLPFHRGRNAPTWSIFEQNDFAGVTWHIVDANIDNGDIVFQEEIPLERNETALGLIQKGHVIGIKGFIRFFPELFNGSASFSKQFKLDSYIIHHSTDVPNDGILNLSWGIDKISAFLRALDLGPLPFFDRFVMIGGDKVLIKGYCIVPLNDCENKKTISFNEKVVRISENDLKINIAI